MFNFRESSRLGTSTSYIMSWFTSDMHLMDLHSPISCLVFGEKRNTRDCYVRCRKFFPSPGWSPICTGLQNVLVFTGYLPGSDRCFLDPCGWIIGPQNCLSNCSPQIGRDTINFHFSPEERRKTWRIYVAFFSRSYCSFLLRVYSWKVFEHLSCLMKGSFHPGYVWRYIYIYTYVSIDIYLYN